eukprot:9415257-Lingulodinium_polyedra.AAC.1
MRNRLALGTPRVASGERLRSPPQKTSAATRRRSPVVPRNVWGLQRCITQTTTPRSLKEQ